MSELPLFPTSVVGSMPRPAWVRRLISDDETIDEADRADTIETLFERSQAVHTFDINGREPFHQ